MPVPATKPAGQRPQRILIVDDHPVVREGLVRQINREPDLVVCGEAGQATQALTVRVEWPSGATQEFPAVAANQCLTLTEPPCLSMPSA